MRDFGKRNILFTFVKVNESCNAMIKVMEENYNLSGNTMNVTDLSQACQNKTKEEVTKAFVDAASFILSAAVGGGKKGGKAAKKVKRTTDPLWDMKKFELKQYLSQTAYLEVKEIAGNRVTVENSFGNALYVSKDILEGMYSADHYKREAPMNMTMLAELLQTVKDHIFTVTFKKQPTEDNAIEAIKNTDKAIFK